MKKKKDSERKETIHMKHTGFCEHKNGHVMMMITKTKRKKRNRIRVVKVLTLWKSKMVDDHDDDVAIVYYIGKGL